MFDLDKVSSAVRYMNFQKNSLSPTQCLATGKEVWSKSFKDVNSNSVFNPNSVLVSGAFIAVVSSRDLLIYDSSGKFIRVIPLGENTPAVFGEKAMAYIGPANLMNYEDYQGGVLTEEINVAGVEEWSHALLLKPGWDSFLAVTQFSGGPNYPPPHKRIPEFLAYRQPIGKFRFQWSYSGEGSIDFALLTPDEKALVLIQGDEVVILNPLDGSRKGGFKTGLNSLASCSLNPSGHLILAGKEIRDSLSVFVLQSMDLSGKIDWAIPIKERKLYQPPASGATGEIFLSGPDGVQCFKNGKLLWEVNVNGHGQIWITVTNGSQPLLLRGKSLFFLDEAGNLKFRTDLSTQDEERFEAPPVLDAKGKIYIASSKKLYCVQ